MHNEGQNSCPLFMNFNKWRQILQTSYNKPLSRVSKRTILFLELPLGSSILNDELLTMNYELKKGERHIPKPPSFPTVSPSRFFTCLSPLDD